MTRTAAEAFAETRHELPNITAGCVDLIAGTRIPGLHADPQVLAVELGRVLTRLPGRPWMDDDIAALAVGLQRAAAPTEMDDGRS